MTRIEFWSAVMGLLVAIVVMFNQMNGRIDDLNGRIDAMQVENQRQHDATQVENQRQHDATQTEINQMRTEMNRRFDTLQAENQRQHDAIQEVLRVFEGGLRALKKKPALALEPTSKHAASVENPSCVILAPFSGIALVSVESRLKFPRYDCLPRSLAAPG